jgi:predicted RecB family nuclease
MKSVNEHIRLAATDLSGHITCGHLTTLDLAVATGQKAAPEWHDPDAWVLQQRGLAHESAFLDHLNKSGLSIIDLRGVQPDARAAEETRLAMKNGADVISQAVLLNGRWFGRADVLRRIDRNSSLGGWSYEIYDCKLARETTAATILQLSLYSDLLAQAQGAAPAFMHVVPPLEDFAPVPYRVLDFAAYYRLLKHKLEQIIDTADGGLVTYPEPNTHCDFCRWWKHCNAQWRKDDHLSLVAGISKLHRKQLESWEVTRMGQLAVFPLPLQRRPDYGSKEAYVRVREQARIQVEGRDQQLALHEMLDISVGQGLARLPEPSDGDIFFDLEGDPFVGRTGIEYLFGFTSLNKKGEPVYYSRWCNTPGEEKVAFEWFVDFVVQAWSQHPEMHIYHFTAYEPSALKRLMGKYASREDAIDRMLRGGIMVDLHTVLKQSVRASVESYSLKELEVFHNFKREIPLEDSRRAIRSIEHDLELGNLENIAEPLREIVRCYNRDDCLSTNSLRNWLEERRTYLIQTGKDVPRPKPDDSAPPPGVDDHQQRVAALFNSLTKDIPIEPAERTNEQTARWLLANVLDWHRREEKANWWEFFRLAGLPDEDLLDERAALSGLQYVERVGMEGKLPVDRYQFARQDTEIRAGDTLLHQKQKIGSVQEMDLGLRLLDIKKMKKTADTHPSSVFTFDSINAKELANSLLRLAAWVQNNGIESPGEFRCARDLLLRLPPRLSLPINGALAADGESTLNAARRLAPLLDSSVLPVQGPPGAGKTYTGARMICELVRRGKKIGITALSHKVIRNLLLKVVEAAKEENLTELTCVQKVSEQSEVPLNGIEEVTENAEALHALETGHAQVVAGTAWLWSREEFFEAVDVLFVDEAGQMSLANVLAVAQSAANLVLLGDPQQLEQPLQGSHPDGAAVSTLEHLLDGRKTISPEQGLFLEETWRLHPNICNFTSELFYDSRLKPRRGLERQYVEGHPQLNGAGIYYVPVEHNGNQSSSPEEVDVVAQLVESLLQPTVHWVDFSQTRRRITPNDILIIAPYNAQVSELSSRLPGCRIGTVDKFQGQEAPIVIYSLTTSSPEDAPRGMEFLYSLNRLNVATSRGRARCILVGSPRLLEPQCHTPRQMQLANALCRFVELAQTVNPEQKL